MTCILRAGGKNFDVDSFVEQSLLTVDSIWYKGKQRFPKSTTNLAINEASGLRIVASEAEFSALNQQIEDVIAFLQHNQEGVKALSTYPGVEGVVFDFGAEIFPPGWSSFTFPSELLSLAGAAGASITLSVYPTENDMEADA